MCGIAGVVTEGEHVAPETLDRMCDAVRHRGPDGAGTFLDGGVALGMRRLAINDLVTGDQPFHSEDRTVTVVGNGEIYNQADLRRDLVARGHRFVSGSDIEVIVHLWEEHGARCVDHLRGMFSFAVWDARERVLFLARDRVGKKPLLYAHHGGALVFASRCGRCSSMAVSRGTSTLGRSTRSSRAATSRTTCPRSGTSRSCRRDIR
jgi:asparagine synthase (glutamine-hydrolysing)